MSFMTRDQSWGYVLEPTLTSYAQMGEPVYFRIFAESLTVALHTTLLTLAIGYPFAYFTALMPPGRRETMLLLLVVPFWTNSLVRIYGLTFLMGAQGVINTLLISLGVVQEPLKLLYNYGAVLVGMVYALLPFMILGIYNSVEKLDWSVVEAARDLGAGRLRAFLTMILPLTLPGIMAGCVLVFVPSIGLYFISDIMGGGKTMLLGDLIRTEMTTARNWPFGAALSVVMLALSMFFLLVYRKMSGDGALEGLL
jgi:spermidine/putrescine transport system permease protein